MDGKTLKKMDGKTEGWKNTEKDGCKHFSMI